MRVCCGRLNTHVCVCVAFTDPLSQPTFAVENVEQHVHVAEVIFDLWCHVPPHVVVKSVAECTVHVRMAPDAAFAR